MKFKVICTNIGTEYTMFSIDGIYDAEMTKEGSLVSYYNHDTAESYSEDVSEHYYIVYYGHNLSIYTPKNFFITMSEYRENQINDILY